MAIGIGKFDQDQNMLTLAVYVCKIHMFASGVNRRVTMNCGMRWGLDWGDRQLPLTVSIDVVRFPGVVGLIQYDFHQKMRTPSVLIQ